MKTESEIKTEFVKRVKKQGGYARRFEDQYAVGLPDVFALPLGGRGYWLEFKIIRGPRFAPTPRQFVELKRIRKAAGGKQPAIITGIAGCDFNKTLFLGYPHKSLTPEECIELDWPWSDIGGWLDRFAEEHWNVS